ncbi:MAG: hypothetical protein K6G65_05135 [Lachnospiraceae bacterium]|nr:hypothetical protein [Lachnospiraceae bacterium]
MKMKFFAILGGDVRNVYLYSLLKKQGQPVLYTGLHHPLLSEKDECSLDGVLDTATHLITGIPFTKDDATLYGPSASTQIPLKALLSGMHSGHTIYGGLFSKESTLQFQEKNISYLDFMQMESVAKQNSVATAEGAIYTAMNASPLTIWGNHCFVLGFGKCGTTLSDRLRGLCAKVHVFARNSVERAEAMVRGYNAFPLDALEEHLGEGVFIFNTIPSSFLPAKLLAYTPKESVLIDIASAPGCLIPDETVPSERRVICCPGLPARIAPLTSAQILLNCILDGNE